MPDITTSLTVALNRAIDNTVDGIAIEGLKALRHVLDTSGFRNSPYLKDHEVYSHVSGQDVTFEIVLNAEALEPVDTASERDLKERAEQEQKQVIARKAARTYGLTERGHQRIVRDARKPMKDARKSARSTYKTADDRLIGHEIALHMPRRLEVRKGGKLSISFRRSIRQTSKSEISFPRGQFAGIPNDFIKKLKSIVAQQFASELSTIIKRYV